MNVNLIKIQNGSITTPRGFKACGVRCGLKQEGLDLALIVSDVSANVAAMFTTNRLRAAPVILSEQRAKVGKACALVINSGNANTCTGEQGLADAKEMTAQVADRLSLPADEVLVNSTGVIGIPLPMEKIRNGIDNACQSLSEDGGKDAAMAIMTTDTKPKHFSVQFEIAGRRCSIGGIAKGSGMINPHMATMICVLTTDVRISTKLLRDALAEAVDVSLNALTVDGEMSTNDAVYLFANGVSGNETITAKGEEYDTFVSALKAVSLALTKELALDGEGATKLVTITVENALSREEALKAAKSIANSMLFKTAIYGKDPNWGRVVQAVGASGSELNPNAVDIYFADILVAKNGGALPFDSEAMLKKLGEKEISVQVSLGIGSHSATVYTCDLTHDYITINADYTT